MNSIANIKFHSFNKCLKQSIKIKYLKNSIRFFDLFENQIAIFKLFLYVQNLKTNFKIKRKFEICNTVK